jgi:hypothetical protein
MSRLSIRSAIASLAILTSVSFINQAEAQTPPSPQSFATSSAYITGASGRDYIKPFSGFGVSMLPDSCFAYANIASDVRTITNLLSLQMKQVMESYYNASCNTQSTSTPACSNYLDTINNLALSYATYQVEGLKQASEKTRLCNVDNTRKTGVSPRTYYEIDVTALTYASVRDAYVGNKFRYYTTLINNVNKNLTSKMNVAIRSGKFTDKSTDSSSLRSLARNTLNGTPNVAETRSRVIPPPATTNLTNPNAFLFFGQTDNVTDKTIAAIPMNSLQEYASLFNANPTRFGDIYNKVNSSLLDAGSAILMNINKKIDLRLPPREVLPEPVAVATTTETIPAATQKASVINSIGSWFGDVWGAIADFFGYMFWGEKAEAIYKPDIPTIEVPKNKASGSGASGSGTSDDSKYYKIFCPALPNPVPKQKLVGEIGNYSEYDIFFHNLMVSNPKTTETEYKQIINYSGVPLNLSPLEKQHSINLQYLFNNEWGGKKDETPSNPEKDFKDATSRLEAEEGRIEKEPSSGTTTLSKANNPYDCLRNFETYYGVRSMYSDYATVTVIATVENKKQTASDKFYLRPLLEKYIEGHYQWIALEVNDIHMKYENERKNKANK